MVYDADYGVFDLPDGSFVFSYPKYNTQQIMAAFLEYVMWL